MSVIAVVATLHAVVFWMLLKTQSRSVAVPEYTSLGLLYLTPKQSTVEVIGLPMRPSVPTVRLIVEAPPAVAPSARALNLPPLGDESNSFHPSIDWARELSRAAEKATSEAAQVTPREFGARHVAPAPAPKLPEFAWKRSRTNRLERVTEGTAIHLGEHCVMSVTPLPVFSCKPGKNQADGDLFEHMRDVTQEKEGSGLP
jgi:hypothetical protein